MVKMDICNRIKFNSWNDWWVVELLLVTGNNTIDFITIATTGNAQDFGDLTVDLIMVGGTDPTRFVVVGGYNPIKC